MSTINKFAIIGERCSGTNFLEKVMKNSFKLEQLKGSTLTIDHKHWMQPENYQHRKDVDNVLFIGIIRDPIQWLSSIFRKQYHVPVHMKHDCKVFMLSEWYSINDEGDNQEIMHDRHPYTKDRFKNIFELRKVKGKFLLEDMPTFVKHYLFIKYEDLMDDMPSILQKISQITGKPCIKDSRSLIRKPKHHAFTKDIMNLIKENIDKDYEAKMGYSI